MSSEPTAEKRTRVLVLSTDPIGPEMPGPAIRAWELANVLGRRLDVVLASTVLAEGEHPVAELRLAVGPALPQMVEEADVIFAPSALVYMCRELRQTPKPVAVDIYDPYHLENLEMQGPDRAAHDYAVARLTGVLNVALRRGDFFTCASERQRDFWLGSLAALGRVNPYTYEAAPLLDRLVSVVPFGLPAEPPRRSGPGVKGAVPGIAPDDKVVLWGGGVYNWVDPLSVLRAVDRLRHREPRLRLVFLGLRHPNPDIPEMGVAAELQRLSGELGLTGRHVFFNTGWVPYDQRANFLLDADVAVSAHLDHIETRYSFRSRTLDYLWAARPMVLTEGDVLAQALAAEGLALAVPAGDDRALEQALAHMLAQPPPPAQFAAVAARYRWEVAAAPLLRFCLAPERAPDLAHHRTGPDVAGAVDEP
jgi:glycosyltransferase involved in cell wall biosynthesis